MAQDEEAETASVALEYAREYGMSADEFFQYVSRKVGETELENLQAEFQDSHALQIARFLDAVSFDVDAARDLLKKHELWLTVNPWNEITIDECALFFEASKGKSTGFLNDWQKGTQPPIMWMDISRFCPHEFNAGIMAKGLALWNHYLYQHCTERNLAQGAILIDVSGGEMWQAGYWEHARLFATFGPNHVPNFAKCYIINSPPIFSTLYALIRPVLTESTISRTSFIDVNPKVVAEHNSAKPLDATTRKFFEEVPPHLLPTIIGGSNDIDASLPNFPPQ